MCEVGASNTLELPYYNGIGCQRGCGFGAFAQVIGRTAVSFLRKYIVPAAKRVGADLLEFAVPEVADENQTSKKRGFITYKTTKKIKKHKEDTVFTETGDDVVEFIEEDEGVPHITHMNNILHSILSNAELYINNHQIYNSNGLFAHKSHNSNKFKSTLSDYKGVLHCEGFDYEEDPEKLLKGPFFTRRMKLYSRPDDFMLYGKLGIDFLTTS